jgi:hypothetical protein
MDTFQGALGGPFVLSLLAMPFYLLLGITPLASQLAVYCTASGLVAVVYVLLDRFESRAAALVAAASFAFLPPALFFSSAALGNLHWTQLIFDYGLVLLGLELVRRGGSRRSWAFFGLLCGLALFHSMGSLPYLLIAACGTLVFARPGFVRTLVFACGAVLGAAPFFHKLLVHKAFGIGSGSGEQTVRRLIPQTFDISGFGGLIYPEGPTGLLFHKTMEDWPLEPGWTFAVLWTLVLWLGFGALVVQLVSKVRPPEAAAPRGPESAILAVVPVLFVLVFALAYAVLPGAALDIPLPEFMNVRQQGFRNLPALWAALMVGSAVGFTRLAACLGGGLRRQTVILALVPALCGLLGAVSLVQREGPEEQRSLHSFRSVCFDAFGVFAASSLGAVPWRATDVCSLLDDEGAQAECQVGAAWGVGMEEARLPTLGSVQRDLPAGAPSFRIAERTVSACGRLPDRLRGDCFFGVGWTVGLYDWGRPEWPATACDSLVQTGDRAECWTGVGFLVGDHLHPHPESMARVIARAPAAHRAQVAEGAGVGLGRGWGDATWAASFCQRMKSPETPACLRGVRRSFAQRSGHR